MARTGENIYKRKDGRWEARYIFSYDSSGKARYKYLYAKTYTEVKAKLLKAKNDLYNVSNLKCPASTAKYDFWLNEWLKSKKLSVKESTYVRYLNMINNHIKPGLGKYPIDKISTDLVKRFIEDKLSSGRLDGTGGLSVKTISDILTVIKETFRYAQASGVKTICSFDRITLKNSTHEMRVLSELEQNRLIAVLFNHLDLYKLGIFICLYTGIRIGELCALQWKHISFSEKVLVIEHTMQRLQIDDPNSMYKTRIIITEPKSTTAIRMIPLPDFVLKVIKPYAKSENAFVLSGKCNRIIEPRTMQNKFKKYLKEAKIKDANFHSLRHTFATRCVEAGFDVKTLSEILGHSNVKITLDCYVHSSMQLKRDNMEKLNFTIN